ncbi:tyrosine-type recombinase/integrase [Clostridium septicum]|uniref:Integrase n=1 Tax=Clostridium septicum TaxID=1504 RepID=A0A9N7JNL7_CLOSE|nr:tyrosine-type recombinase/integrase [Clostridium septicum]AYE35680.1 integrase [Clostridium septicum]UEC19644.1 tyrosine-type recombinase/integrase [Clostridium septicum]USS02295.1 tyrosine-type recombinase/integrase [Clostridium septicum]
MSKRNWEKGTAQPIPNSKYTRFKETLREHSEVNSERNIMLFILARATGYRMQDLVCLTIKDIKLALKAGEFNIQEQKQYKQWVSNLKNYPNRKKPEKRKAEIGPKLERYLMNYVKNKKDSDFAFESKKGNRNEFITQKSYSLILSEVGKKIGLKNISGHSPRKTYATKIYEESNFNVEKVRVALGHKSIEETKRYLGLKEAMKSDAARIADEGI